MKSVKTWLRTHKKTQAELAALMGCQPEQVNRWIRGRLKPSMPNLARLSDVTGISLLTLAHEVLE